MYTLAITISLYDRWLELGGLLELLRLNWEAGPNLHITVISTAEAAQMPPWIDRSLIDHLEFGSRYQMPKPDLLSWVLKQYKVKWLMQQQGKYVTPIIRARTVESMIRGGRSAMESGAKYMLHLHAAAWPLLEEKILEIIEAMHTRGAVVGCRGYGKKWIDPKRPAGDIDDNFLFIDNDFAGISHLWDFDPKQDAAVISNEGRLARRLYECAGAERIYFYNDFSQPDEYVFPTGADQRRVQPYNYHRPLGLLRSHDLSKQAQYCQELNLQGPIINRIIREYSTHAPAH